MVISNILDINYRLIQCCTYKTVIYLFIMNTHCNMFVNNLHYFYQFDLFKKNPNDVGMFTDIFKLHLNNVLLKIKNNYLTEFAKSDNLKMIKLLQTYGTKISTDNYKIINYASKNGNLEMIKRIYINRVSLKDYAIKNENLGLNNLSYHGTINSGSISTVGPSNINAGTLTSGSINSSVVASSDCTSFNSSTTFNNYVTFNKPVVFNDCVCIDGYHFVALPRIEDSRMVF